MSSCYEITNLVVKYPLQDRPALDSLSVVIKAGSFNVVLGSNGSGKSTFIKCLAGVQQWQSGSLLLNGVSRGKDNPGFNSDQIHISEDVVLPNFSVQDLMVLYKKFWPDFSEEVCKRVLSYSSIPIDKSPARLSRGQKILVQFALGIATGVRIILVDEVTAALDAFVRRRAIDELSNLQKSRNVTVVLATNIATEVEDIESYLILLKSGKLFLAGDSADLRRQFENRISKRGDIVTIEEIFSHLTGALAP